MKHDDFTKRTGSDIVTKAVLAVWVFVVLCIVASLVGGAYALITLFQKL